MKSYPFGGINKINLLILFVFVLSSCNGAVASKKRTIQYTSLKNAAHITSKSGRYSIEFSPSMTDMPLNHYFDIDVLVTGITQQPLSHTVRLTFDAGMKAHNHGLNVKPIITSQGNGKFKIEGVLLHMSGTWFLRFNLFRGVMSDHAEFDVLVDL
jgi:hypothetical protein